MQNVPEGTGFSLSAPDPRRLSGGDRPNVSLTTPRDSRVAASFREVTQ